MYKVTLRYQYFIEIGVVNNFLKIDFHVVLEYISLRKLIGSLAFITHSVNVPYEVILVSTFMSCMSFHALFGVSNIG